MGFTASLVGKIDLKKYHLNKYKITPVIASVKEGYRDRTVLGNQRGLPGERRYTDEKRET